MRGIDGIFAGAQRLLPDALMAGPHQAAELEVGAGCVLRGQADVGLDDRNLALFDNQHRHLLHADQERIEVVSAVEKRIVLQADFSAGLQELLEVLIVVVLMFLLPRIRLISSKSVTPAFVFKLADIFEFAEPAGDGAGGQRLAFECSDDADHVHDFAAFGGPGRDARDFELPIFEAEGVESQPAGCVGQFPVLIGDGNAEDLRLGDDEESHRVDGRQRAGRKNRPLHALLAALRDEAGNVGEVAERGFVHA